MQDNYNFIYDDRIKLGHFNPYTWEICLNTQTPTSLVSLSERERGIFEHEFGHLLHYFTTYVGLTDLMYWILSIQALELRHANAQSQEEQVTFQSRSLLEIARKKQILSIDDFYYLEYNHDLASEATKRMGNGWRLRTCIGHLFKTDGTISNKVFWGIRFYLDDFTPERSFVRIPVGMRMILEHLVGAIDVVQSLIIFSKDERSLQKYMDNLMRMSNDAHYLHYYALTQYVSAILGRIYRNIGFFLPFIVTAQILLILSYVPFDDQDFWETIQGQDAGNAGFSDEKECECGYKIHDCKHPSFLFPVILRALEQSSLPMDQLGDPNCFADNCDHLLKTSGLPCFNELITYRDRRLNTILEMLKSCDQSGNRSSFVQWMIEYDKNVSMLEKILIPAKYLKSGCPVSIQFNDGTLDGIVFPYRESALLEKHHRRYMEMLRYPIARDIVNHNIL